MTERVQSAVIRPSGIITLLTDFGRVDPYVGIVKGVILSRFGAARLVDLTHQIPPQDVEAGSFWLEQSYHWFPAGTVHLAVVDPGVGSARRALAVRARNHWFVLPDNGLLPRRLTSAEDFLAHVIEPSRLGLELSKTFHGRDLFAPVAAILARGHIDLQQLGPTADSVVQLPAATPLEVRGTRGELVRIVGKIVCVDRFGNLISTLAREDLQKVARPAAEIDGRRIPVAQTYASVATGQLVALIGSTERLEVACRDGSAAEVLGLGSGAELRLIQEPNPSQH